MSEEFRSAEISSCEKHRYELVRIWDRGVPMHRFSCVNFIGLNPSTADASVDDATIRVCRNYAKSWGFGGMVMTNLFSFRARDPKDMKNSKNPYDDKTDQYIIKAKRSCKISVACWGNHGTHMRRGVWVQNMFKDLYCLRVSKTDQPMHPLYQSKELKPIPYNVGTKKCFIY